MPPKKNPKTQQKEKTSPQKKKGSITVPTNVEAMTVVELKHEMKKMGITDSDIKKTGYISKQDRIKAIVLAIQDVKATSSPKKSITISKSTKKHKKSPRKGKLVSSVETMKMTDVLTALKNFPKYSSESDYYIKKDIGKTKPANLPQLRQALINLVAERSGSPTKGGPKKISPKKISPKKISPKKISPKKTSPKKTKKKKVKSTITLAQQLKCNDRKLYEGKFCDTKTGKFVAKNATGKPRNEKQFKDLYGDDYVVNEKFGIFGPKDSVDKHIKFWKEESGVFGVKKTKKGKKISKYCGRSSGMKKIERYKKCDEKEICDIGTGYCVPSTSSIKKGRYILEKDGRSWIGNKETIDKVHKILGGSISIGEKFSPKSVRSKKIKEIKEISEPIHEGGVSQSGKDVKVVSPMLENKRQMILDAFYECMEKNIK